MSLLSTARHWFTPHHTNNHRARALHADVLAVYAAIFVLLNVSVRVVHRIDSTILGFATDIRVEALLSETNKRRESAGLQQLALNSELSKAAADKAADMFSAGYWAHVSPDGKTPWVFISNAGYAYSVAGENLAKNFSDSASVVDAWMNSPTHRDNLLKGSYRDIGFAIVNGTLNGEETTLVVQMFGATKEQLASNTQSIPSTQDPTQVRGVTVPAPADQKKENSADSPVKALAYASSVTKTPLIDVRSLTKTSTLLFGGMIILVLLVDAWVVAQRRIVRISGHNVAHVLFIMTIVLATLTMYPGSIL